MGTALLAPGAAPPLPGLSFLNRIIYTPVSALFSREVGQSFSQQTVPEPHLVGTEQGGVQGGADCPIKRASPRPQVGSGGRYTACGPAFTCRQQQIGLSSSRPPPQLTQAQAGTRRREATAASQWGRLVWGREPWTGVGAKNSSIHCWPGDRPLSIGF